MSLKTFPQGLSLPLDATSIADGSVTNTEFQYLDGVTSDIQTQLDALGSESLGSYLAATVTYNNDGTLGDTALSVTVEAGETYAIAVNLWSESAVKGLQVDFGGTATITNFQGDWVAIGNEDPLASTAQFTRVSASTPAFVGFDGFALTTAQFKGSVKINGAGTFLLRGAQNAADASNTTILAGATLVLTKLT